MNADQLPLVTIITVTYNSARYVRDTIESVLAQQYTNIEYIIADDCSTDDTWQVIKGYSDHRITAYRNEKNLGEYPNRNKAIEQANGKYLIFIDGDDLIYPHGVKYFVDMMEAFPEAGMLVQKDYLNNVLLPALILPEEAVANYFLGANNLLSSSFASDFYRTGLLKSTGLLATGFIGGDNEIRLRMALLNPVLLVAGWVSWPRETPGQASSRISPEIHLSEDSRFIDLLKSTDANNIISPALWAEFKANNKKVIARYCLRKLGALQISKATSLLNKTGTTWSDVFRFCNYKSSYEDVLDRYSPGAPLKRGYSRVTVSSAGFTA